jgi:hypothetical protein
MNDDCTAHAVRLAFSPEATISKATSLLIATPATTSSLCFALEAAYVSGISIINTKKAQLNNTRGFATLRVFLEKKFPNFVCLFSFRIQHPI